MTTSLFRGAVLEQFNMPLTIRRLRVPDLLHGQVLIKVKYSGLCRSQIMEIGGRRGHDKYLPHLLGHEGIGTVIKTGPSVSKVNVGDEVIISWIKSRGISAKNAIYKDENENQINAGPATTLSEMTIVSENRVSLMPNYLPANLAALFGCALLTGMGMALKEVKINTASTVLIYGLGGIGLGALIGAASKNPRKIIVVDKSEDKRILANKLGVYNFVNQSDSTFLSQVHSLNNGLGVDICLEAGGTIESIESAFACLNRSGKLIFASHPDSSETIRIFPHELISGKIIKGTWGGSAKPDKDLGYFSKIFLDKNLTLADLGIKEYFLEDINLAISEFDQGKVLRPLIKFL